jgi:hypothetical protein
MKDCLALNPLLLLKPLVASSNILESGAVHTRVDPSGDDSSVTKRDDRMIVHETPVGQVESVATTAQVSSMVGPPTSTTSHRLPRSAHNTPRYAVPIGKKEEHAMCNGVTSLESIMPLRHT